MNKKELYKYIHAFILGDGGVYTDTRDNGNSWFSTTKTEDNYDFIEYANSILENVTTCSIKSYPQKINNIDGKEFITKPYYRLVSKRHPIYTKFRNRMYPNGYKCIDPHYLKLLDWETLAILFMDDGTTSLSSCTKPYGKYTYPQIELCTHSFSYADNLLLATAIKERLEITFYVVGVNLKSGRKYKLEISQKNVSQFIDGVEKFILPSFVYKLNNIRTTNSDKSDDDIV